MGTRDEGQGMPERGTAGRGQRSAVVRTRDDGWGTRDEDEGRSREQCGHLSRWDGTGKTTGTNGMGWIWKGKGDRWNEYGRGTVVGKGTQKENGEECDGYGRRTMTGRMDGCRRNRHRDQGRGLTWVESWQSNHVLIEVPYCSGGACIPQRHEHTFLSEQILPSQISH